MRRVRANMHPLDAALNLPEEKQSHGLRKLAAIESARGSFEDAAAAMIRATGGGPGNGRWRSWHCGPPPTWTRSAPIEGPVLRLMTTYWC